MTDINQFMQAIRTVESGGRYNIGKNASGASGAYQFLDSTWGNYGGFASAYLAPPEVQDERARQLMQAYYDQFGDWDHVAAAWIGGPGTAAKGPAKWGSISDSNMSVASYVQRVNGALSSGVSTATQPMGAGVAGAAIAAGTQAATTPLGGRLTGVLGAVSPNQVYAAKTSAQHGDTLGDRLSAIHELFGNLTWDGTGPTAQPGGPFKPDTSGMAIPGLRQSGVTRTWDTGAPV